ncbi:MAG: hypothetical protein KF852_13025 [Saprospiraceae bacterium]|nr:hypothetical protein [Saprospiraceae bacterium]
MRKIHAFLVFSALLYASACGTDKPNVEELLPGRWTVADATRDNRPTTTLTGLFFEFAPDGRVNTNINNSTETMRFTVVDNIIQQRQGTLDADYKVETMSDKEMVVTTRLYDVDFKIRLVKAE